MTQGSKLRLYRHSAKITQKEIAARLAVNQTTYGAWEADSVDIKPKYFVPLAEALGVSVLELLPDELATQVAEEARRLHPVIDRASHEEEQKKQYGLLIDALQECIKAKNELIASLTEQIQWLNLQVRGRNNLN